MGHDDVEGPLPIDTKRGRRQHRQGFFKNLSLHAVIGVARTFIRLATSRPCKVDQTLVANGSSTIHVCYPTMSHFCDF